MHVEMKSLASAILLFCRRLKVSDKITGLFIFVWVQCKLNYIVMQTNNCIIFRPVMGWYTYDVHGKCSIFKTTHHPCPSTSEILQPSWPWTSNFKRSLLFSQWYRACERAKSKQKQNQVTSHSNWPCVLFFNLAPQTMQYSIIKR